MTRAWAPLLALTLLAAALPALAANQAILQVAASTSPATSPPGSTGSIVLAIKNIGDTAATSVLADVSGVDGGLQVNGTSPAFLGGLGAGEAMTVSPFTFHVPAGTRAGFYRVTLGITFSYTSGGASASGASSVTATVTVRSPAALAIAAFTPDHLQPGQQATANVTLANLGPGPLSNIDATWTSPGGTILPLNQSDHLQLARLPAYGNATLAFPIAASATGPRGLSALVFVLRYNDETGARLNGTFTLGIVVGGATTFQATVSRLTDQAVALTLANVGLNPATAVVVTPLPGGVALTDGPLFLGPIDAGAAKPAEFHLAFPGAAAGQALHLAINYTDPTGAPQAQALRVPLPVGATNPGVAVNVQGIDGSTVTLAVTNTGSAPVTGVQVRLDPGGAFRVTGATVVTLGNLKPGEFLTADFEVHRAGGSGAAPQAEVGYTDSLGDRQDKQVPLDLAAVGAGPWPTWGVVAATVAAVLVAEAAVAGLALAARRRHARQAEEDAEAESEDAQRGGRPPPPPAAPPPRR